MYKGLQSFCKTTAVICTHAPKTLLLERLDEAALLLFYNLAAIYARWRGRLSLPLLRCGIGRAGVFNTEAQRSGGRQAAIIFCLRRARDCPPYQAHQRRVVGGGVPSAPFIGRECAPPYLPCAAKRLPCIPWLKTALLPAGLEEVLENKPRGLFQNACLYLGMMINPLMREDVKYRVATALGVRHTPNDRGNTR